MSKQLPWRIPAAVCLFTAAALLGTPRLLQAQLGPAAPADAQNAAAAGLIKHITRADDRLEMVVQSSKMLTLDMRVPKVLVNNPAIVELHPRAANVIQVVAKKAGYTQIVLWDENNKLHTIDVLVTGDARELALYLKREFPTASLRVYTLSNSVVVSGSVDDPSHVAQIMEISQDFFPKVINRISVGGVQQVLLHTKVIEVSRTKLRKLGFDWAYIDGSDFAVQTVSGLITEFAGGMVNTTGGETFAFGIVDDDTSFFGVLEALRQNNISKVLAEPNLVTVSGRPAFFNSGGEFPILVPQSLGTVSIEYKRFGTQVDFVPIVLANGNIRLEVRPRISEIDTGRGVTVNNVTVPGLRVREVDTGVEMRAGQTLAIAGLVQTRMEGETKGLPWLMDLPYVGAAFRRVQNVENEIELLILVTPELVAPLEYHEIPPGGPGLKTQSPSDHELFGKGYIEVPRCCDPGGVPGPYFEDGTMVEPAEGVLPLPAAPAGIIEQTREPSGQPAAYRIPSSSSPSRHNRASLTRQQGMNASDSPPGFVGPTGYDVGK